MITIPSVRLEQTLLEYQVATDSLKHIDVQKLFLASSCMYMRCASQKRF